MKTYDLVLKLLKINPVTRNSDRLLIWEVYKHEGLVKPVSWFGEREAIIQEYFLSSNPPSSETITRTRRKIVERYPELDATDPKIRAERQSLAKKAKATKGLSITERLL